MAIRADGTIRIDTKIDDKGFDKGVKNINSSVGGLTKSVGKLGLALGVAFSVKTLIQFGKTAVKIASDLEEVQNVVNVAFGEMTGAVDVFAKEALEKLGMSELTAKRASSSFMVMARSMGIAQEKASTMALEMTNLVGDVASFYNISHSEAMTALESVYTGNALALRRLGIVMSETTLSQFALTKGIDKSIEKMTEAEKTQLRYLFVQERLSLAQGDFVRNQNSWANQTKILKERFDQLKTTIGKLLVDVLAPFVKIINNVLQSMILVAEQFNEFVGLNDKLRKSNEATAKSEEKLAEGIDKATDSAKRALLPFDTLTILKDELNEDDIDFGIADFEEPAVIGENMVVSDKAKKVVEFFNTLKDEFLGFKDAIDRLIKSTVDFVTTIYNDGIKPHIPLIIEAFTSIWELVKNFISSFILMIADVIDFLKPLVTWLIDELLPPILFAISSIADALNGLVDFVFGVFTGDWERAWNGIKDVFINIWEVFDNTLRSIEDIFDPVMTAIYDFFGNLYDKWNEFWNNMAIKFKNIWEDMVNFMKTPINTMIGFINTMINAVVDGVNAVLNALNKISVEIPDWKIIPSDMRGQKFGFDINKLTAPQIPYLAKGAIIPPNSEFMAVLGDQKTGTNIETPEGLLREIIAQGNIETANYLGEKLDRLINEVAKGQEIVIDGRKMSRALDRYMQEINLVKGRNLGSV